MRHRVSVRLLLVPVLGLAAPLSTAAPVTVPPDLQPGHRFRLVFVTSTMRDATSAAIANYNAFVSGAAASVPELAALGTDWTAIASTPSVDARNNTDTNPNTSTGFPVYNLGGSRLANDYADLWDNSLLAPVDYNEFGVVVEADRLVWTGSSSDGVGAGLELGTGPVASAGLSSSTNFTWMSEDATAIGGQHRLYAISGVLTIVPEPATAVLLVFAAATVAARRGSHGSRRR